MYCIYPFDRFNFSGCCTLYTYSYLFSLQNLKIFFHDVVQSFVFQRQYYVFIFIEKFHRISVHKDGDHNQDNDSNWNRTKMLSLAGLKALFKNVSL